MIPKQNYIPPREDFSLTIGPLPKGEGRKGEG